MKMARSRCLSNFWKLGIYMSSNLLYLICDSVWRIHFQYIKSGSHILPHSSQGMRNHWSDLDHMAVPGPISCGWLTAKGLVEHSFSYRNREGNSVVCLTGICSLFFWMEWRGVWDISYLISTGASIVSCTWHSSELPLEWKNEFC